MNKIGRKLYFDKSGNMLLNTGEKVGHVKKTSIQQDLASYKELKGLSVEDVIVKEFEYGEKREEFNNAGSIRLENNNVVIYPRLTLHADKAQILADGEDTVTITSDYPATFSIDGEGEYTDNPFLFSSEVPGIYTITAKSELHGENHITIEVIESA